MRPDTQTADPSAGYAYSNHSPQAAAHHAALSGLLDAGTIRYLAEHAPPRGFGGARVLVPAAGGGAILHTLSNVVGPDGLVVATDLHPEMLPSTLPNVEVVRHDLNDPLPDGPWDLIHARLILSHLPDRARILQTLIDALAPGGMLVVEDFDPVPAERIVAAAPTEAAAELMCRAQQAHRQVLDTRGNDPTWTLRVHGLMVAGGMVRVHSQSFAECWPGRSPGARLLAATLTQLRDDLAATGMVGWDAVGVVAGMLNNDPGLVLHGHRMVTTSGFKPDQPRRAAHQRSI